MRCLSSPSLLGTLSMLWACQSKIRMPNPSPLQAGGSQHPAGAWPLLLPCCHCCARPGLGPWGILGSLLRLAPARRHTALSRLLVHPSFFSCDSPSQVLSWKSIFSPTCCAINLPLAEMRAAAKQSLLFTFWRLCSLVAQRLHRRSMHTEPTHTSSDDQKCARMAAVGPCLRAGWAFC